MSDKNKPKQIASSARKHQKADAQSKGSSRNQAWIVIGLGLIVLLAVVVLVYINQGSKPATNETAGRLPVEISVEQAASKRDAGAFILDVRQPEEWNEYHIPGSTLIPLGELSSRLDEIPKDQEIVVVCRSGNRSQEGRDTLLSSGFEQVSSMAGGVSQWRASGYETVSGP